MTATPVRALCALIAAALLHAAPVAAQRSADTLRIAGLGEATSAVWEEEPLLTTELFARSVFDTLMCYDPERAVFEPLLASSWTQSDPLTTDFTLRDDVTFQDGSPFTADDVVYTLRYLTDPASKLRFALQDFGWLDRVEKIDAHRVRLVAKKVDALAMLNLAILGDILPAKLHAGYANKSDFGRQNPIGTGPYRVTAISASGGVALQRFAGYRHGGSCKPAAQIERIKILPIPDPQARIAQFITGGIDLAVVGTKEEREALESIAGFTLTPVEGVRFTYLQMDSLGRAGNAALSDERVRRAIVQGLDRDAIIRNVLSGGPGTRAIDALCAPLARGCEVSVKPYSYDPAAARRLLTEAGYADGFDVVLTTAAPLARTTEAIAGELRKLGIRATVRALPLAAYFQEIGAGTVQMSVSQFGGADTAMVVDAFFDGAARDYWRDPVILPLVAAGRTTLDPAQRKDIYRRIFDRMNEKAYLLPLATTPADVGHVSDLVVPAHAHNRAGLDLNTLHWR